MLNIDDAESARKTFEKIRWPNGVICPHCKHTKVYTLKPKANAKRSVRQGVYKCAQCRKQFTVTVGTIFEGSHIPLHKWLLAIQLLCASKKGMSSHQLHRMLGITYKSAWFMAHRIRYAMKQPPLKEKLSGIVEADETYVGGRKKGTKFRGGAGKQAVISLVERKGQVKSFAVKRVTKNNLRDTILDNVSRDSHLMTDRLRLYRSIGKEFAKHDVVWHEIKEYVRGDAYTNTVEGYFSILKRGIHGVYHHVGKNHLQRYVDEFDFRYNSRKDTDGERTILAIRGTEGKRLTYKEPIENLS